MLSKCARFGTPTPPLGASNGMSQHSEPVQWASTVSQHSEPAQWASTVSQQIKSQSRLKRAFESSNDRAFEHGNFHQIELADWHKRAACISLCIMRHAPFIREQSRVGLYVVINVNNDLNHLETSHQSSSATHLLKNSFVENFWDLEHLNKTGHHLMQQ